MPYLGIKIRVCPPFSLTILGKLYDKDEISLFGRYGITSEDT
jgi:hypothetical protein